MQAWRRHRDAGTLFDYSDVDFYAYRRSFDWWPVLALSDVSQPCDDMSAIGATPDIRKT